MAPKSYMKKMFCHRYINKLFLSMNSHPIRTKFPGFHLNKNGLTQRGPNMLACEFCMRTLKDTVEEENNL
jgi:hypothetical protein